MLAHGDAYDRFAAKQLTGSRTLSVRAAGTDTVAYLDPDAADELARAAPSQRQRKIIHVDVDAFYASVE